MVVRYVNKLVIEQISKRKVIVILGPRQVGKTTLLSHIKESTKQKSMLLDCDEPDVRELLRGANSSELKRIIGSHTLVFIDEAQRVKDIGLTLKLIADKIKDVTLIVTGSSSFELSNKIKEPLTGRKREFQMYPLSFAELVNHHGLLIEKRQLNSRLIYGSYPEVITRPGEEKEILSELADSYLFRDIFSFQDIRKPDILNKLVRALALQAGSQVSFSELAGLVGIDMQTVERYIQLLEAAFVIFRLPSLARNVRNELKKSRKIYFYDNGIRNALIANFSPLELRTDKGALWENYLVSERIKYLQSNGKQAFRYFWRTTQKQEIDYIEEVNNQFYAYEFKYNAKKQANISKTFTRAYDIKKTQTIHRNNYDTFLDG